MLREKLRTHMPDLCERYRVRSLGLFGSQVRGTASEASDVDILVDYEEAPTFFEFVRLEEELSQLLDARVDLVMRRALRPELSQRIQSEVVAL